MRPLKVGTLYQPLNTKDLVYYETVYNCVADSRVSWLREFTPSGIGIYTTETIWTQELVPISVYWRLDLQLCCIFQCHSTKTVLGRVKSIKTKRVVTYQNLWWFCFFMLENYFDGCHSVHNSRDFIKQPSHFQWSKHNIGRGMDGCEEYQYKQNRTMPNNMMPAVALHQSVTLLVVDWPGRLHHSPKKNKTI